MKAIDLMIGDWVQIETIQAKVIRLHQHFVDVMTEHGTEIHTTYQEVSPILLTEKILKANGLKCIDKECCWYKINGFVFYDYEHGSLNNLVNGMGLPICNINYVHELQHALRLCGLTNLADNFKIKAMEE